MKMPPPSTVTSRPAAGATSDAAFRSRSPAWARKNDSATATMMTIAIAILTSHLHEAAEQALHDGSDIDRLSVHASAVARRQEGGHVGNLVWFDQAARRVHFGQG